MKKNNNEKSERSHESVTLPTCYKLNYSSTRTSLQLDTIHLQNLLYFVTVNPQWARRSREYRAIYTNTFN